ncbi:aminotransferase class III-fold pyridoxal phosphate-dependent enzyme, partial [Pseudomonas aeruginosa]|nr:aminotransferase class III-fold pyridoxal phosphate-dependent enzyme [Pseudomonas aeruginosa]
MGDIRGTGCMMGIEFVTDKAKKTPAADLVASIVNAAVKKGLILEAAGTYNNVIRFLCPLCVT